MTTYKGSFISFTIAALLVCKAFAAGEFSYTLEPKAIMPGEHVRLELRIPVGEGELENDPVVNDSLLQDLKAVTLLQQENRREGDIWLIAYEFTGYRMGEFTVPPVEIKLGPQSFSTEAAAFSIKASRPEGDEALRPEEGLISTPIRWARLILIALLTAIACRLVIWLMRRFQSRRRVVVAPPAPVVVEEDPLVWLKKALADYRAKLEAGAVDARSVDELTAILKEFFARKTKSSVRAWTTTEFIDRLHDEKAAGIARVLRECDDFKFAHAEKDYAALAKQSLNESERILVA